MLGVYVFMLLLATTTARDISAPLLKPGATSFVSQIFRTRSKTNPFITLALSATKTVVLDLTLNVDLLSPNYEEIEIGRDGTKRRLRGMSDIEVCWYKGKIVGDESSQVSVVDCDGYFDGFVQQGDGKSYVAKSLGGQGEVAVYTSEDEVEVHGTCGALSIPSSELEATSGRRLLHEHSLPAFSSLFSHSHAHTHYEPQQMFTSEGSSFTPQRKLLAAIDVMEVAIVSDNLYMQSKYGGVNGTDKRAVATRNVQLLEVVKQIYESAAFSRSTSLLLKAQYFFTQADPYNVPQDSAGRVAATALLNEFRKWSINQLASYSFDNIHLLTGFKFDTSTIGIAYVGAACSSTYNTGLSTAYLETATVVNLVAHELGHNLGMDHDGESSGAGCASSGSLMGPYINSCGSQTPCPISTCSIATKNSYSDRMTCLRLRTEPTCNDGLWNGDEQGIDCGGTSCIFCDTQRPSARPTPFPTSRPTLRPTLFPTPLPTVLPTPFPTTPRPTPLPTTPRPTPLPTTLLPTPLPTPRPTLTPTLLPTPLPTLRPTPRPTPLPTRPTLLPTLRLTPLPTSLPTSRAAILSTSFPTRRPTLLPTSRPTRTPTRIPTRRPTKFPSSQPTRLPTSRKPTKPPTSRPTNRPTRFPTVRPSPRPTTLPTRAN